MQLTFTVHTNGLHVWQPIHLSTSALGLSEDTVAAQCSRMMHCLLIAHCSCYHLLIAHCSCYHRLQRSSQCSTGMPLLVIGAGLCRTGTSSLREALDKLGLGPCYHMKANFEHSDSKHWIAVHEAVKGGASPEQLKQMFESIWKKSDREYRSAVDYPSQGYYKQLADIYPDAKVVRRCLGVFKLLACATCSYHPMHAKCTNQM